MAHTLEVELEEEDSIEPLVDETNMHSKPPLTSDHLSFSEMGIVLPLDDKFIDVSNLIFSQMKKKIVYERRRYFPNDPAHPISISREKLMASSTKRNSRAIMETNLAFETVAQDNKKYLLNANA